MSSFGVEPSELRSHAGQVGKVAASVSQAAGVGTAATALSPVAFGMICSFFTPPTLAASGVILTTLGGIETALSTISGAANAVADVFETVDQAVGDKMNAVIGSVADSPEFRMGGRS
jgi:hypothetical protein